MSAEPARHLHVVDADTGEKLDGCPMCQAKDDEIAGLERALRAEIKRFENLKRDKAAEAQRSEWWPIAVEVFRLWRRLTSEVREEAGETRAAQARMRTVWNADRFYLIEPFLGKKALGPEMCVRAVSGIAYDHFETRRKNGSRQRFDEWERCFKDTGEVEKRAAAAPAGWRELPAVREALESIEGLRASQAQQPKVKAPRLAV